MSILARSTSIWAIPNSTAAIEDALDDLDADLDAEPDENADPRLIGLRLWGHRGMEELLPGEFDNLAFDAGFSADLSQAGASGDVHLPQLVASYDHAWAVTDDGASLVRLSADVAGVDVTVAASDLAPDSEIVAVIGDDAAVYALAAVVGAVEVVELDPTTGDERDRVTVPTPGGRVWGADANADWLTMSFNASAIPIPLIGRGSLTIEREIENLDHKAALLTTDRLAVVEGSGTASGGDSLQYYDLGDGSTGERIEMSGNGTTRAFSDTILQFDDNTGVLHGVTGDGPTIVDAIAATGTTYFVVDDISIDGDLAVVTGCCADTDTASRQTLFAIDLASGEILLTSSANGTVVMASGG